MNNMLTFLKTASVLCMVDLVWFTTGGTYGSKIVEDIQGEPIQMRYEISIILFIFLSYMLLKTKSAKEAFLSGICMYGSNSFTCYFLFQKYDWRYGIVETLWGGVLFVTSGYLLQLWTDKSL
jgi:hypothetical protein